MTDGRRTTPADRDHIDLSDPYCVQHWARSFRITELDLAVAVQRAGPLARDVAVLLCRSVPEGPNRAPGSGDARMG
ncbi:DUF3606 domain-containing protein [Pararoseomonas sp. SCSIO 73927]|uniref:DUF3606 domain-containing protein n=1 Tax=Pararoseomonas sp. SCSIO 73927 TaxID=3114537 RepID=UPI0030CFA030